jgi:hypothetical protein
MVNATWNAFLTSEWYSVYVYDLKEHGSAFGKEIFDDRDIYGNHSRYPNIFAMRAAKLRYLVEDLPLAVKHYHFVRFEDILLDPLAFCEMSRLNSGKQYPMIY